MEIDVDGLPAGLVEIIERQFPGSSRPFEEYIGCSKRSEFQAFKLDESFRYPLVGFGLGPDEESWKRLRRASVELKRALVALGNDGMRELNWTSPAWWDKEKPLANEAYLVADLVREGASEMMEKRRAGVKASKKRDWCAAALAKTARSIWAEEAWHADWDEYGPAYINILHVYTLPEREWETAKEQMLKYDQHLREFAPKAEKHDAPGPFGRFLEEILALYGRNISAASALRSMNRVEDTITRFPK
ncbi:hypothetical protein AB0T83_18850 [Fluviibacterium sp. DFM31]|uniref:Uncharacterized protein n=1 Tax=Meridianimarinicoccus marinus TaxID=3231483 RepID=A0ABV3LB79_9RHOB